MNLKDIANKIKESDKNIILIYAFNGTGKTRLSRKYKDISKDEKKNHTGVYYNAYSEDLFVWDNDEPNGNANICLKVLSSSLNNYYQSLKEEDIRKKLDFYSPSYNFYFNLDDDPEIGINSITFFNKDDEIRDLENGTELRRPIKISRGEERIFVWCFFLALFDIMNDVETDQKLNDNDSSDVESSNEIQDGLVLKNKYIFIDDPVSSLDDINVYSTAEMLFDLFDKSVENKKKIIITTHHLGLFSILCDWLNKGENASKYKGNDCTSEVKKDGDKTVTKLILEEKNKYSIWILERKGDEYVLKSRNTGSWLYHLLLLKKIDTDSKSDNLYRYHIGLLRQVLEITASFIGRNKRIGYVLEQLEDNADVVNRINEGSHKQTFDYQDGKLVGDNKEMVNRVLRKLIDKYKFDIN